MNDLSALLYIARKHWLTILFATILGMITAVGVGAMLPVRYETRAELFVAAPNWNDSTAVISPDATLTSYGDQFTQQRIESYVRLAQSTRVLQPAIDALDLPISTNELAEKISVRAIPETVFIEVGAQDASAVQSAAIANTVANQLSLAIRDLERSPYRTTSAVQPVLTKAADQPTNVWSPAYAVLVLSGALVGLLIGCTAAAVREQRRHNVFARWSGAALDDRLLGWFRASDEPDTDTLPLPIDIDEDLRILRLSVQDALTRASKPALVVAAPHHREVALQAVSALAAAMSEVDEQVVVVLLDPSLSAGDDGRAGLSELLSGACSMDDVISAVTGTSISVIGAGDATEQSAYRRHLATELGGVVAALTDRFDLVLLVAPPVLESAVAADAAGQAGGSALVFAADTTSPDEVRESERLLRLAAEPYLGCVIAVPADYGRFDAQLYQPRARTTTTSTEQFTPPQGAPTS